MSTLTTRFILVVLAIVVLAVIAQRRGLAGRKRDGRAHSSG